MVEQRKLFYILFKKELSAYIVKFNFSTKATSHSALQKTDRRTISFYNFYKYFLTHQAFLAWVVMTFCNCHN